MSSPPRRLARPAPLSAALVGAAATVLAALAVGRLPSGRPGAAAPLPLLYAAAGDAGLHVVDFASPAAPASIGSSQRVVPSVAVAASGNVVYVAAGAKGLGIFDVRDPKVPFPFQVLDTPRFEAARLVVDGPRLYALDPALGVRIFEIHDPYAPALKGTYHEAGARWTALAASGDLLVLLGDGRLRTVDVADPAKAAALGELDRGGADVALRDGLAYVAGERGLGIADVRRPKEPRLVGADGYPQGATLDTPRLRLAAGRGRPWAFVGGGFNGTTVGAVILWDVGKPTAPAPLHVLRFAAPVRSLTSDGDALDGGRSGGPGELLFAGTAANLHSVAWLDASPAKPQVLAATAGLADAAVVGLVLDPRERDQATPTAAAFERGSRCVVAAADAWVSPGTRGVNHGTEPDLFVGAGGQDNQRSYVRFALDGVFPADAEVVTGVLEVELIDQQGGSPFVLQSVVDAADAPWDEATITFLNRPAHSGRYAAPGIDAKAGVKAIDVAGLVDDWHAGRRANHGLVLWSENTVDNPIESRFGSRENTRTAPPRLCVGWQRQVTATPAPTDTPTAPPSDTPTAAPSRTPAPTDTATTAPSPTAGPSATGEPPLPSVTPEPTRDATAGPTRTALPTARPTARPSATATLGPTTGGFARPDAGAPLPLRRIRRLRFGPGGELFARVPDPAGGPDIVVTRALGRWRRWGTVEQLIEQRYAEFVGQGVVPDFFAADARGRIWAGAHAFDGRVWRRLATDVSGAGGALRHDQRALLDRAGAAWVPFAGTTACANPLGCPAAGVRAFDFDRGAGVGLDIVPLPEMAEYALEDLQLVHGRAASGAPTLVAAQGGLRPLVERLLGALGRARHRPSRAAGAAAADDVYVVSPTALYVLPDTTTAIRYPLLPSIEEAGGDARNAGYATTSAIDTGGRLVVFTWVERHEGRSLAYQLVANTWLGAAWDAPLDLAPGSPLLVGGSAEFVRLSAAAFAADGTLWLGTSDGQVAAFKDGAWPHHFTAVNSPLVAGEPISALSVAADGALWISQPSGLLTYGGSGVIEAPTIYLPRSQKP